VQKKAARWSGIPAQAGEEGAPCLQAVNREREVSFGCESELREEDFLLSREVGVLDPAIEATLAEAGVGEIVEVSAQGGEPIGAACGQLPGVETKGGLHKSREALGEIRDLRPIILGGAIDNASFDPSLPHGGHDHFEVRRESSVVKVIVSVEERRHRSGAPSVSLSSRAACA
jgi:hypothetical protein